MEGKGRGETQERKLLKCYKKLLILHFKKCGCRFLISVYIFMESFLCLKREEEELVIPDIESVCKVVHFRRSDVFSSGQFREQSFEGYFDCKLS